MGDSMEADAASRIVPLRADAPVSASQSPSRFAMHDETLEYWTEQALQFIDITDEVRAIVERSGIVSGQVTVFSQHTTAAVIVNEHEPLLLNDMARTLSRLAPAGDYYE